MELTRPQKIFAALSTFICFLYYGIADMLLPITDRSGFYLKQKGREMHLIHIGVVNFETVWGDKVANLKSIEAYCEEAGKRGVELLVFPETALTGYLDEPGKDRKDRMQVKLAETIPGPSTQAIAAYAEKYHMYIIVGMPERDPEEDTLIYNSAAIITPSGSMTSYRKIHLPGAEADWSVRGDAPTMIDTPWGPIGVGICYDTYVFPELQRYYKSMGARLYINVTACPDAPWQANSAAIGIPAYAFLNCIYIASANLCNCELDSCNFIGGSSVIGPQLEGKPAKLYVGTMFLEEGARVPGLYDGTVDLSIADNCAPLPTFVYNPRVDGRDFRADIYAKMYQQSHEAFYNK